MTREEKKDIEDLIKKLSCCELEYQQNGYLSVGKFNAIKQAIQVIEKQQKEIEELKWKCNNKYYHTIKCRELEKEINNSWKDKINKLKEEVETELISNPYDFSYLLNELLEEE
jgi:hypothetical protein